MKNIKLLAAALVAIVVVAAIGGALILVNNGNSNGTETMVIMDDRGENITLPTNPQRIISLGSSFTEIIYAIGAEDQLVGVDTNSLYPEEVANKTNVGSTTALNMEVLVSLDPDCVIAWTFSSSAINSLEALNISVVALNPQGISGVLRVVNLIGNITGQVTAAASLVSTMETTIDVIGDDIPDVPDSQRPKVYFELRSGKSVGPGTITDELITLAGGINVYGNSSDKYPLPSNEYLISVDPDVIIIEDQSTKTNEMIAANPGWQNMTAVVNEKIFRVDGSIVSSTPRLVDALEDFAYWFYDIVPTKVVITDDRGLNIIIPRYPERIVSLGSSFTEILFEIGADEALVGVDKYSTYPEAALNKTNVGSTTALNIEIIADLDPDVIICWSYSSTAINTLENLNYTVVGLYPKSVRDVVRTVSLLGEITGNVNESEAVVADMNARIDAVLQKMSDLSDDDKPRVYWELRSGKTTGTGTISAELIDMAGGENIFSNSTATYFKADNEHIIALDPEIVVIENQSLVTNEDLEARSGWAGMTAIIDGKIYRIDGSWVSSTPRVILALEQFAMWFHPELYA